MNLSFPLGHVTATPGALETLQAAGVSPSALLDRHARGDWGEIASEDRGLNEQALITGERLFSVYHIADDVALWVITEAADEDGDRVATTILRPDEY